jgi:peptidyl-prolyl cis-trans isomerase SurA
MENKYPQFAITLNNFKEKILAGYLLDEILSEKAENDEIGLNNFYKKNTTNYNKSYIADVCIFSYNPEKSNKIEKQFNKIKEDNLSGQDLENNIRIFADNEFTLIKCGKFKEGDETHVDECIKLYKAGNINKEHRLIFFEAHKLLLILNDEIKINEKPLDEVKNSVIVDYRTYLENNFLKDLKQKYSVVINQDIFESIKN